MKKLLIALVCFAFYACNDTSPYFTQQEKDLINSGNADDPMRVLLVTDKKDSLFLRQKSKDISPDDENLPKLIERMRVTMEEGGGIGIAAVQVGVARNVMLVIRLDKPAITGEDAYGASIRIYGNPVDVFINPKIIAHPNETKVFMGDGCLSIPYYWGNTERYESVDIEYYNEKGELIRETIYGVSRPDDFTAVIFQHEFDHLQGVLFLDRIHKNELFFEEDLE